MLRTKETQVKLVKLKNATPALKEVVKTVSRKRSCFINIVENPEHYPNLWSYWDGGSRNEYFEVNLLTMRMSKPSDVASAPPQFGGDAGRWKKKANTVLIQCGSFCGKPATPHLYIAKEDVHRFEPLKFEDW